MIILKFFHTIFCWICIIVLYFLITAIIWPLAFFSKKPELIFFKAARVWSRLILAVSLIRVKLNGLEKFPQKGSLIIASNHQSMFDIFILIGYLPRYFRFVAKKELFKIPFLGWYMRKICCLSIDRQASIKAHRTLEEIKEKFFSPENQEAILIFPEGTRSPDGQLKDFKRGSFAVALSTGTPILPVAISGSYKIVPKGRTLINPQEVSLSVGDLYFPEQIAVPSKSDCEMLNQKIHDEITSLLKQEPQ